MNGPRIETATNVKRVAHVDVSGGGQIVVNGTTAYIGHMAPPDGTSIVDVSDPSRPEVIARVECEPASHSHKVRVVGDLMLANREHANKRSGAPYDGGGQRAKRGNLIWR